MFWQSSSYGLVEKKKIMEGSCSCNFSFLHHHLWFISFTHKNCESIKSGRVGVHAAGFEQQTQRFWGSWSNYICTAEKQLMSHQSSTWKCTREGSERCTIQTDRRRGNDLKVARSHPSKVKHTVPQYLHFSALFRVFPRQQTSLTWINTFPSDDAQK